MAIDYKLIGQRIQLRRKAANITQAELAEKMNVTPGYISQIERGITKVNLDTLGNISDLLECDISSFISNANTSKQDYDKSEILHLLSELSEDESRITKKLLECYINNTSKTT